MTTEPNLDRLAVERCLAGERDAFSELVLRYERPIFAAVLRMVGNPEEAREIVQQAFMKAFEHLSSYDRNKRFFSWMYRVAINEAINHLHARRPSEPLDEELPHFNPGPDTRFEQLEEWGRLHEEILNLEPNYVAVIILRHFVHLSYDEIAAMLKVPEKTVKSRLFAARQQLREALESRAS